MGFYSSLAVMVITDDTAAQLWPSAGKVLGVLKAVSLQPGESVSTIMDVLTLKEVRWPRGGARLYRD